MYNQPISGFFHPVINNNRIYRQLQGNPMVNGMYHPAMLNQINPYTYYGNTLFPNQNMMNPNGFSASPGFTGAPNYPSVQMIFDNPLHPIYNQNGMMPFENSMYPMQIQAQQFPMKPSGIGSIINSFKNQDGNYDFNKMFSTAGQFIGVINQVSSLLKGFSQVFKV
ncbi:YppG family protein [Caldibacillus lycopersici]|uniref:YppG family protein n=1 Tax=Perspicuibacillus lycopersici TaxID=1325689 RepID=A0AAE3ISN2_9BACI|nr:YppG family protein [Perspicuibacillus lycopersici]MCU9613672.1 YppG family protein [Perspicuibacillus lycopersici]